MPKPNAGPLSIAHSDETQDFHRAVVSLMEELDAIDWYTQRAELCTDASLRAILLHNKDEEVEHAMMLLEWLRRECPAFDLNAEKYLFSEGSVAEIEAAEGPVGGVASLDGSLRVGSLKRASWTA